jgi:hypothetical protein
MIGARSEDTSFDALALFSRSMGRYRLVDRPSGLGAAAVNPPSMARCYIASAPIAKNASAVEMMSAMGVRRDKAAFSNGCKPHPATAPAGSNRSSHGGNEVAEAFD